MRNAPEVRKIHAFAPERFFLCLEMPAENIPSPPRRDRFAVLALAYLLLPSLVFLLTWVRPVIGLPTAMVAVAGIFLFWRHRAPSQPRPQLTAGTWVYVLGLALLWTFLAGIGGFVAQASDYEKHNLAFHDLLGQAWPVYYHGDGETHYLCYGLGYYLPPALLALGTHAAWLPAWTFLWGFAGVALFFYWVATFDQQPKKTLIIFLVFATTETLWHMFLHVLHGPHLGQRGLDLTASLIRLGIGSDYSDSWMSLQYRPQHVIPAWPGAALFYDFFWVRRSPRGMGLVLAACCLWSPMMSLGLLLVPVIGWKRWRWPEAFEPANYCGAVLMIIVAAYVQGHVHLTEVGPIWKFARGGNWPALYAIFLLFQLSPMLFLFLADWKYRLLGELRPLFWGSLLLLLLLPIYKIGYYGDLRLQAGTTALLFCALAATQIFQHAGFSWKKPLFALLLGTQLFGAAYPFGKWWKDALTGKAVDYSYDATYKLWSYHNLSEFKRYEYDYASQYLGRTNTPAGRWLLRPENPPQ